MKEKISPPAKGLDFGCGPGPALAIMLQEAGYDMQTYDPYFANRPQVLQNKYDLITCTEVVEHLAKPRAEFDKLISMLNSNGLLGIMTDSRDEIEEFENWHYRRDPTHICFYSNSTFNWISQHYNLKRYAISSRVNIFRKMD